jgi:hypothetical protein
MKRTKSKNRNVEETKRLKLEYLMKQYPKLCFCEKPEYSEGDYIRDTEKSHYSIQDKGRLNPFSLKIFKCRTCGKEHTERPEK